MKNRSIIIAMEPYSDRVAYLRELVERTSIEIVEVVQGDSTRASTMPGKEISYKALPGSTLLVYGVIAKLERHGEDLAKRDLLN